MKLLQILLIHLDHLDIRQGNQILSTPFGSERFLKLLQSIWRWYSGSVCRWKVIRFRLRYKYGICFQVRQSVFLGWKLVRSAPVLLLSLSFLVVLQVWELGFFFLKMVTIKAKVW